MGTTINLREDDGYVNIATGPTGVIGPYGEQGPKGFSGFRGFTGPTGQIGDTGPQGPIGVTGGISRRGPTAPITFYAEKSGTRLLYKRQDFTNFYVSGDYSDGRGNFIVLKLENIEGNQCDIIGSGYVTRTNNYGVSGSFSFSGRYTFTDATLTTLTNDTIPIIYNWTDGFGNHPAYDVNLKKDLTINIQLANVVGDGYLIPVYVKESPLKEYSFGLVDETPTIGNDNRLVTSNGVATAYCSLIDKIAASKGLTAAQVAQMKALYGA